MTRGFARLATVFGVLVVGAAVFAPVVWARGTAAAPTPQPLTVAWIGGVPSQGLAPPTLTDGPAPPSFASLPHGVEVKSAAIGTISALAIGTDGNLYAWGNGEYGQLGDGAFDPSGTVVAPEQVFLPNAIPPAQVAVGFGFSVVLGANGDVYTTGLDNSEQLGDGGPSGAGSDTFQPVALPAGVKATSIAAGWDFALAVGSDGHVYAWGDDAYGQLGDDTYQGTSSSTPEVVPLPSGATAVSVQGNTYDAYALSSDGTLYSWGWDGASLGNSSAENPGVNVSGPVAVAMPSGVTVTSFSTFSGEGSFGDDVLAIGSDGSLYGWGYNVDGELGDGSLNDEPGNPKEITVPGATTPADVGSGPRVSFVVDSTGQVYAAGLDVGYDLGPATPQNNSADDYRATFAPIDQPSGFVAGAVYAGGCSGCDSVVVTGSTSDRPYFTADAPPSSLVAGSSIDYTFAAGGHPAPTFALAPGAPGWLSINSATGELTGTAPSGYGYAEYSVVAQSDLGATRAGPFYLYDKSSTALVSGQVRGSTVDGAKVEVCVEGTNLCPSTTVGPDGAFSLSVPSGTTVDITAYPPAGQEGVEASDSIGGLPVDAVGLSGVDLRLSPFFSTLNFGLDGSNVGQSGGPPNLQWTKASGITDKGCSYGVGLVTVVGTDTFTQQTSVNVYPLTESPAGSGDYLGTIPPQYPIHGAVEVEPKIMCAFGSGGFLSSSGSPNGGNTVTILGSGFTGATSVSFGSTPATSVDVLGDGGIQVTAPAGTGTVPVEVTTPSGTQNAGNYTYDPDEIDLNDPSLVGPTNLTDLLASTLEEINPQLVTGYQLGGSLQSLANTAVQNVGGCSAGEALAKHAIGNALGGAVAGFGVGKLAEAALGPSIEAAAATEGITAAIYGVPALSGLKNLINSSVDALSEPLAKAAMAQLGCPPQDLQPNAGIDPSGNVLDTNGNPIVGATVTILRSDAFAGPFMAVDPSSAGLSPNVNPETTDAGGAFMWDVDAGYYEVQASAAGCTNPLTPALSNSTIGPLPVPPPQVGLTVTMACADEAPAPTPAVTGLSATTGADAGGTDVQITGTGFTPDSTVDFASTPAADVIYLSPETLDVTSPAGAGTEDVTVTTAGGTSATSNADQFFYGSTPTVTGLSVTQGPAAGGTTVRITGTGFTGATDVAFGDLPTSSFTVDSDSEIEATAPGNLAGTVDVIVVTPAGGSATSSADQFTYLVPSAPQSPPASNPPAGSPPTSTTPVTTAASAPRLTAVRLAARSFTAKAGATLRLTLSQAATIKVLIERVENGRRARTGAKCKAGAKKGIRCTLLVRVTTLSFNGKKGANKLKLMLPNLRVGTYEAVLTAHVTAAAASKPVTLRFAITKPKPTKKK